MHRKIITKTIILIICFAMVLLICSCQNKNARTALLSDKTCPKVIVFYFHRTVRCSTCLEIEAGTARIIKENFPQLLAKGFLKWIPFNLDDEKNEELEKQFDITSNTLVLAGITKDNKLIYKKLEDVWQFVGNSEGFSGYVTNEINKFMNDI